MGSLEETDRASQVVAVAPRVTLDNIKNAIDHVYFFTGEDAAMAADVYSGDGITPHGDIVDPRDVSTLTVCFVRMKNGFTVIGHSAPASPENFNPELGRKFAYENAIRQLWPMMAFSMLDRRLAVATEAIA